MRLIEAGMEDARETVDRPAIQENQIRASWIP